MTRREAVKEATKVMIQSLVPAWGGLLMGICFSFVGADPTWKTYVFWSCIFVCIPGMVFVVSYLMYRKDG